MHDQIVQNNVLASFGTLTVLLYRIDDMDQSFLKHLFHHVISLIGIIIVTRFEVVLLSYILLGLSSQTAFEYALSTCLIIEFCAPGIDLINLLVNLPNIPCLEKPLGSQPNSSQLVFTLLDLSDPRSVEMGQDAIFWSPRWD